MINTNKCDKFSTNIYLYDIFEVLETIIDMHVYVSFEYITLYLLFFFGESNYTSIAKKKLTFNRA